MRRSPVTSVEMASQSGPGNHAHPKTETHFGQSVRSLLRFRQVGDNHLGSYKKGIESGKEGKADCLFELPLHGQRSGAH